MALDKQKIYVDQHRVRKDLQVGERVYFWIKPRESSLNIGSCAKLTPHFCGPFEILERIGTMAYMMTLPPLVYIHDVLHVSFLKRYT